MWEDRDYGTQPRMTISLLVLLAFVLLAVALVLANRWRISHRRMAAERTQQQDIEALGRQAVEQARSDIEKLGWHLLAISGDEQGPGFAYTIGLSQPIQHPHPPPSPPSPAPPGTPPR